MEVIGHTETGRRVINYGVLPGLHPEDGGTGLPELDGSIVLRDKAKLLAMAYRLEKLFIDGDVLVTGPRTIENYQQKRNSARSPIIKAWRGLGLKVVERVYNGACRELGRSIDAGGTQRAVSLSVLDHLTSMSVPLPDALSALYREHPDQAEREF